MTRPRLRNAWCRALRTDEEPCLTYRPSSFREVRTALGEVALPPHSKAFRVLSAKEQVLVITAVLFLDDRPGATPSRQAVPKLGLTHLTATGLLSEAAEVVGKKSLWTVPREGGEPTRFHEFGSDQIHSGIGVSPDGR